MSRARSAPHAGRTDAGTAASVRERRGVEGAQNGADKRRTATAMDGRVGGRGGNRKTQDLLHNTTCPEGATQFDPMFNIVHLAVPSCEHQHRADLCRGSTSCQRFNNSGQTQDVYGVRHRLTETAGSNLTDT